MTPQVFAVILIAVLMLQNTQLAGSVAYVTVVIVYLFLALFPMVGHDLKFIGKREYLLLYVILTLVVFGNVLANQSMFNSVRLFTLLTFTTVNIFLLPQIIPLRSFLRILSRISAIVVVVGFAPLVGFPSEFGFIDLSIWGTFWVYDIVTITSVFVNPNQLGALTLLGAIAALEESKTTKSISAVALLSINSLGLFLSHYRTGWAAFIFGIGLFVTYTVSGRKGLMVTVIGGLSALLICLLMMFNIIPGPNALTEISLNGRRELWTNTARVIQQKPYVGHGFEATKELTRNPHNSYLRMFASFGIFGGTLYAIMMVGAAIGSARKTTTYQRLTITILIVSFVIINTFNQLTFIGVSMRSTLSAICLGYYVSGT